ncbi:MAG TPA: hypothetical protein VKX46_18930 [Ktedonobacteraceae bacterium]|nr:hypothetical protein [Ktedonobacteraceae bacterium]
MIQEHEFIGDYRLLSTLFAVAHCTVSVAEHPFRGNELKYIAFWHGVQLTSEVDTIGFERCVRALKNFSNVVEGGTKSASPYLAFPYGEQGETEVRSLVNRVEQALAESKNTTATGIAETFLTVIDPTPPISSSAQTAPLPPISVEEPTAPPPPPPPVQPAAGYHDDPTVRVTPVTSRAAEPGRRKNRRTLLAVVLAILLVLLAFVGYTVLPVSAAQIVITPKKHYVKDIYTVPLVTSKVSGDQVPMHTLSTSELSQSQSTAATGKGQKGGAQAQGQVQISQVEYTNTTSSTHQIGESIVTTNSGVEITVSSFQADTTPGWSTMVQAHATNEGSNGNIPAYDIQGRYEIVDSLTNVVLGSAYLENPQSFSGGMDSHDYTYVQQSDIDSLANPMKQQLLNNADAQLKQEMGKQDVALGDKNCTNSVTTDHAAEEEASQVKVTVTVSCSVTVYNRQELFDAARKVQARAVTQRFGSGYVPQTTLTYGAELPDNNNTHLLIPVEGWWIYGFDARRIANDFTHRIIWQANSDLSSNVGIQSFNLTTSGFGGSLPSTASQIKMILKQ